MNENQLVEEQAWLALQEELKETFGKAPDLQTLLFLIGTQELGQLHRDFTKEEKQDLMHIAVCHLLSLDGYFEYIGRDDDGWPHYQVLKKTPEFGTNLIEQENVLKRQILKYFDKMN